MATFTDSSIPIFIRAFLKNPPRLHTLWKTLHHNSPKKLKHPPGWFFIHIKQIKPNQKQKKLCGIYWYITFWCMIVWFALKTRKTPTNPLQFLKVVPKNPKETYGAAPVGAVAVATAALVGLPPGKIHTKTEIGRDTPFPNKFTPRSRCWMVDLYQVKSRYPNKICFFCMILFCFFTVPILEISNIESFCETSNFCACVTFHTGCKHSLILHLLLLYTTRPYPTTVIYTPMQ